MRISLKALGEFIEIKDSPERIAEVLTSLGLEVEGMELVESIPGGLKGVVVGHVVECWKHPNADKLHLTKVDVGSETILQIVCGAPNIAQGQKVLVATEGTILHPLGKDAFQIKKGKIRGEESQGMICAEDELGIGESHAGVMVLDENTKIGLSAADVLQLSSDTVFEIGLTPNRADATNHYGVANDIAAYYKVHFNQDIKKREQQLNQTLSGNNSMEIKVDITNHVACPRYAGICFDNVQVGPSPKWLVEFLQAMDQKSINNIVDISNYVMFMIGQPLHAFDYDKITNHHIHVQNLADKTEFVTLDQVNRKLSAQDLMICDGNHNPLCIAGVLGGINSGVTENTKRIFLESAYFSASGIRKTSMSHGIRSQAARCFEKGTDPNMPVKALVMAANLFKEYANATLGSNLLDIYPNPIAKPEIKISLEEVSSLSGLVLDRETLKKVFFALDFELIDHQNDEFTVSVPTNKPDVLRKADVIEEISRVYGLDHIPVPEKIQLSFPKNVSSSYAIKMKITDWLVAQGLNEIVSLSLTDSTKTLKTTLWQREQFVFINNTSNSNLDIMKPSIIIGGLEVLLNNQNRQQTDLGLFEIAREYTIVDQKIKENQKLAMWMMGQKNIAQWQTGKQTEHDYFEIKSIVSGLLHQFKFNDIKFKIAESSAMFSLSEDIYISGSKIGTVGLLNADFTSVYDLRKKVWYAELNVDQLQKFNSEKVKAFEEFSKFPGVKRDLAVVVDSKVNYQELENIAVKVLGKNLKKTELFDIYENKEQLGENKKSYALSFSFEHMDRTMSSQEIDVLMNKLIGNYESQLNAIIRK